MNIWEHLKDYAESANLQPGMAFETSILGPVECYVDRPGEPITGFVHSDMQAAARRNGFFIEAALPKEDKYILRVIDDRRMKHRTGRFAGTPQQQQP